MLKVIRHNFVANFLGKSQRWLSRTLIALMPAQQYKHPDVPFVWDDVKATFRYRYLIPSTLAIGFVIAMIPLVIIPGSAFRYSLLTGAVAFFDFVLEIVLKQSLPLERLLAPLGLILMVLWRDTVFNTYGMFAGDFIDKLPGYAMREEIIFRAASEHWTFLQKIRACFTFGLMHVTMVVVPVGIAVALAFSAAMLMVVYLNSLKKSGDVETALKEAALVHTLYNITALLIALGVIISSFAFIVVTVAKLFVG